MENNSYPPKPKIKKSVTHGSAFGKIADKVGVNVTKAKYSGVTKQPKNIVVISKMKPEKTVVTKKTMTPKFGEPVTKTVKTKTPATLKKKRISF